MRPRCLTTRTAVLIGLAGCAAPKVIDDVEQRRMLALLMPSRIEIVKPFTRVKSFDSDTTPDGIELLLQAVNSLDVAGRMIVGHVHVGLYEYVPASAEPKGRQLDRWSIDISTERQQRTYWNRLTQMYELQLGIDPARIPAAAKYVLVVTYNSPLGEHLTDECVIDYRPVTGPLGGVQARSP